MTNQTIEKTSYSNLLATELEFMNLVKRLNLSIHNNSRVPTAYKIIDELNKTLGKEDDFQRIKNKYSNNVLFSALYDIGAIASLLPFLFEKDDVLLAEKIKKVCSGDLYHAENQNSVVARNTLFELKTLALLRKSGFQTVLGDTNPDVEFIFEDNTYFVECKRPNGTNISGNIYDAVRQLEKKLRSDQRDKVFGVIAISLEYQFSPNKEVREIQTGDQMLEELSNYLRSVIELNKPFWVRNRKIKDKRILGIMFTVEAPYIAKEEVLFTTASYNVLTNIVDSKSDDFMRLAKCHSFLRR